MEEIWILVIGYLIILLILIILWARWVARNWKKWAREIGGVIREGIPGC